MTKKNKDPKFYERASKEDRKIVTNPVNKKVTFAKFKAKFVKVHGKPTHKRQRKYLKGKIGEFGTVGDSFIEFRQGRENLSDFFINPNADRFDSGNYFYNDRKKGNKIIRARGS